MTELRRELGLFSCTMLVAGNMIGIGIFVTAGRIAGNLPNPYLIFTVWILGGLLSLAGALVYAELATRFPRAGGGYVYLREAFGPMTGFLSGFSSSLVTIPGTSAFLAIGFTQYAGITHPIMAQITAVSLIAGISIINYLGVKWGAELQDGFMVLKLLLIALLIVAGFLSRNGSLSNFAVSGSLPGSIWVMIPLAMVPVMYTYSGWDATVYVAGEVRNPSRTIPLSLFFGTLLVTLVYLLLAALYISAIPVTQVLPETEAHKRIATAAAKVFFGENVGSLVGSMIAISILGCLSATILTGPRILYAMAKDNLLHSSMSGIHEKYATPANAIIYQGIWACFLVVTGTFDQLLDYVTVPSVFFAGIAGIALLILRTKKRSDTGSSPYLSFGYPVLPVLFVIGMFWIVASTVIKSAQDPKSAYDSLWGMVIVAAGLPVYFLVRKK